MRWGGGHGAQISARVQIFRVDDFKLSMRCRLARRFGLQGTDIRVGVYVNVRPD